MSKAPFLSQLGITPIQQAREPVADAFPIAFNPNNRAVWQDAVARLEPMGDTYLEWAQCVARYIQLCERRGIFPFQNTHQARNDQISDFLRDRRLEWVRFMDRCSFFTELKIRKSEQSVRMTETGFVLTGEFDSQVADPSFDKWLTQAPAPKFDFVKHDGRYLKRLRDGLLLYAIRDNKIGPKHWTFGYEISCNIFPDLPANHTPSRTELEKFVLEALWAPEMRAIRPKQKTQRIV
jgi:hypothetical protein